LQAVHGSSNNNNLIILPTPYKKTKTPLFFVRPATRSGKARVKFEKAL